MRRFARAGIIFASRHKQDGPIRHSAVSWKFGWYADLSMKTVCQFCSRLLRFSMDCLEADDLREGNSNDS
ncbi:hypothetical protein D3OALGA1CA_1586 [Olavius algarvensis associated proteobacterium Delta 3]|nr:hypothetical protein D3OALGB2SA_385 [Olavius algarvensis associated proteobacterium Delta 3]CAB5103413.1 hypothetical protein D3OALGA1CA_1586 [Olavius algarvensis associated proteobacterium Delta 3]